MADRRLRMILVPLTQLTRTRSDGRASSSLHSSAARRRSEQQDLTRPQRSRRLVARCLGLTWHSRLKASRSPSEHHIEQYIQYIHLHTHDSHSSCR
jgi:hypothetical protein